VIARSEGIGHLFGPRVGIDPNLMEGKFAAPGGFEIKGRVGAPTERLLRRVVRVAERERSAYLEIASSGRIGGSLAKCERRARSQQSEDEEVSFHRIVSIKAGLGIISSLSVAEERQEALEVFLWERK
jgi:hypothetical protein